MSAVSSSSAYVPGKLEPTPFDSTTVAPPTDVMTMSPNPEVALLRRQTNTHLKSSATGAPIKMTSSERPPRTRRHSKHNFDEISFTDSSITLVDTQQPTRAHYSSSASTATDSDAHCRASWTSGGIVESLRERVAAVFSRTPRVATDPVSSFQTNSQSAALDDTPISSASTPNERTQTGAVQTSFDEDEAVRARVLITNFCHNRSQRTASRTSIATITRSVQWRWRVCLSSASSSESVQNSCH